ncbi:MAG TPA: TQO small subunit DoxD, partial [Ktedonobacteraceae bacterium]|nr:TQO small subunit DoxD [Ktedonobacteraceae bacterium]
MKLPLTRNILTWKNWVLVPLRLFLGVTFIYAGLQKLTDSQYFNPAARGYIGRQIAAFATGTPLRTFLQQIAVPHATLFGGLVAYGELAIGLGVLLGFFLRPAAFFGLLINLTFFLSADWRVFPYFYGSDIVFLFCWLTLLLAGPANQALPSVDAWVVAQWLDHSAEEQLPWRTKLCTWVFGVTIHPPSALASVPSTPSQKGAQQSASRFRAWQLEQARQQGRRNFVWGTLTGGATMLVLAWLNGALRLLPSSQASASDAVAPTPGATPTLSGSITPTSGSVITQISAVPVNSAFSFTLPTNGDPGILVHLANGQFVAYDATCTHAGCPVNYDPSS